MVVIVIALLLNKSMVEIQLASEWSGSKHARFSSLSVCLLLKRKGLGVLGFKRNHVLFIFFQGAFWMLVSGRVQFVLQVSKFGRCLSAGLLQTLLEKLRWMEMNIRNISKGVRIHFQRSSKVVSCKIHVRPCILFVPGSELPLFP